MNNTTKTGRDAQELLIDSLAINAEIALEEPQMTQGVDEAVRKLMKKYGVREVLATVHDAAWSAAEVHEEMDDEEDMTAFRLRIFGNRLSSAIDALK